jgi:hypothetical protein
VNPPVVGVTGPPIGTFTVNVFDAPNTFMITSRFDAVFNQPAPSIVLLAVAKIPPLSIERFANALMVKPVFVALNVNELIPVVW